MILVCGTVADIVTELLCARLRGLGYEYRLLNLAFYPEHYQVNWTWDGGCPVGRINGQDWKLQLTHITGVFVRYAAEGVHQGTNTLPADLERVLELLRRAQSPPTADQLAFPAPEPEPDA